MNFLKELRQSLLLSLVLLALCGVAYPWALTGLARLLAPEKAEGSLVLLDGKVVGSSLVGQRFTDPRFMKGRPSAVQYNTYTPAGQADGTYAGVASGSQNLGPSNPALARRVEKDMADFLAANPGVRRESIPADLLTASGSGLDPHISPAAARIQIPALARHTGLPEAALRHIVERHTTGKLGGVLGEDTVNVLLVNLDIARALNLAGGPPESAGQPEGKYAPARQ